MENVAKQIISLCSAFASIIIMVLIGHTAYELILGTFPSYFGTKLLFIFCCLVVANASRIVKIIFLWFQVDLAHTETRKDTIEILRLVSALLESAHRPTWSGLPNYQELTKNIENVSTKLHLSKTERNYVFEPKYDWEKKDNKEI